jgi:predicted nucleic acid-binding Zn ribbon protein
MTKRHYCLCCGIPYEKSNYAGCCSDNCRKIVDEQKERIVKKTMVIDHFQLAHGISYLMFDKEIVAVIPTEYVQNVVVGLERMYNKGKGDDYKEGYNDGFRDCMEEFRTAAIKT